MMILAAGHAFNHRPGTGFVRGCGCGRWLDKCVLLRVAVNTEKGRK